jgi:LCP family protein required for cell wall assembly
MNDLQHHNFNSSTDVTPSSPQSGNSRGNGSRAGRSKTKFFSCLFILLIVVLWSLISIIRYGTKNFFGGIQNGYIVRQISHIFDSSSNQLRGESGDRINFVLLGMGGPGHEGPFLSDTILLASVKPSTGQVALISIPRDLIVPFGDGSYRKINSVYALAADRGKDYAFEQVKKVFGTTFGQDINYMATIDFQGFVKIIDEVGGVTVDVDRDFTDYQFPTADYKIQEVSFKAGRQKMDGLTALRYARSRHGNNGEGSDFARSKRQQKIIIALKDKLTSFDTLINPVKITSLFSLVSQATATDMEPWEAVKIAQMLKDLKSDAIIHQVLDDGPGNYLVGGISAIDGAYILQPRTGSYQELQSMFAHIFDRPDVSDEGSQIILQNGTKTPGLATLSANELAKAGVDVQRFGNANTQDYLTTTIYDYTRGGKPKTRKALEDFYGVSAKENVPIELLSYTVAKAWNFVDDKGQVKNLDFLIILGADYKPASSATNQIIQTVAPTSTASSTSADSTYLLDSQGAAM